MAKSKYEKYVVRKPAIVTDAYTDVVPETDEIPNRSPADTGPRVIFSKDFVNEANSIVEYGIISGDIAIGADNYVTEPHKHNYEEIFLFLGTDPKDTRDLGAEVEFWIGEGKDREKIIFNTSSSIYVPPGVVHFPQYWRKVTRPVITVVIMPTTGKRVLEIASSKGGKK
ncbi:MAG: hypothetical protein A2Z29_04505 [Chloroflexi bacterium RBG_16_56_11]|nr:MAG: hypothetical protein A2Z29_04505 [Chloroflexi bacterium RBG_16_56_11]